MIFHEKGADRKMFICFECAKEDEAITTLPVSKRKCQRCGKVKPCHKTIYFAKRTIKRNAKGRII